MIVTASLAVVASANAWTVGNAVDNAQFGAGYFSDGQTQASTFYNQRMADNFTLGASAGYVVNSITWWGGSEGEFFDDLTNMAGFEIEIYDGAMATVYNSTTATGSLTVTDLGPGMFGPNVYEFTLGGLNASIGMGGNYLISIGGIYVNPLDDAFVWQTGIGDGTLYYNLDRGDVFGSSVASDSAFRLDGTIVPEPATMAALGLGVAALLRRRRK